MAPQQQQVQGSIPLLTSGETIKNLSTLMTVSEPRTDSKLFFTSVFIGKGKNKQIEIWSEHEKAKWDIRKISIKRIANGSAERDYSGKDFQSVATKNKTSKHGLPEEEYTLAGRHYLSLCTDLTFLEDSSPQPCTHTFKDIGDVSHDDALELWYDGDLVDKFSTAKEAKAAHDDNQRGITVCREPNAAKLGYLVRSPHVCGGQVDENGDYDSNGNCQWIIGSTNGMDKCEEGVLEAIKTAKDLRNRCNHEFPKYMLEQFRNTDVSWYWDEQKRLDKSGTQ